MGKRKPRRRAPTRAPAPKLDCEFDCPFCVSLKSVQVQIKKKELVAQLHCRACNVDYQTSVNPLDEPVDVFSLWIDSCEEVNMPSRGGTSLGASGNIFIPQRADASRGGKDSRNALVDGRQKKRKLGHGLGDEFGGEEEFEDPENEVGLTEQEEGDFNGIAEAENEIEMDNFVSNEYDDDHIEPTTKATGVRRKLTTHWDADDD